MTQAIQMRNRVEGRDEATMDIVPARAFHENSGKPFYEAFRSPSGFWGRVAGFLMSRKNRAVNEFAVELAQARAGACALEIGFGPGLSLGMLAERVGENGRVAGIDVSAQMLTAALKRNRRYIDAGVMDLRLGAVHELEWADGSFDCALSVSNIQFWNPASLSLDRVYRVLRPGGRFVAAIHTQYEDRKRMTPGLYEDEVETLTGMISRAGFRDLSIHRREDLEWDAVLVAVKSLA